MKLSILFVSTLVLLLSAADGRKLDSIKGLKGFDKVAQFRKMLTKLLHPALGMPGKTGKNSGIKEYLGVHELNQMDFPILGLFISGMEQPAKIPDADLYDWFEFCIFGCATIEMRVALPGSVINNGDSMTMTSSMNGTKFHLEFNAADVHLDAPNFLFTINDEEFMRDLDLYIKDYKVSFTGDLVMQPVGLQMQNIEFKYEIGELLFQAWSDEEFIEGDLAPDLMDYWNDVEEEFRVEQEIWLNCFLSNGRVEWKDCPGYLNDQLHRQSFAQIVHAIGLGKMVRK